MISQDQTNRGGPKLVGVSVNRSHMSFYLRTGGGGGGGVTTRVPFYLQKDKFWPAANSSVFPLTLVPM